MFLMLLFFILEKVQWNEVDIKFITLWLVKAKHITSIGKKVFSWLKMSKDVDCAYCKLCNKSFRIDGAGIRQVKSHQKSKNHKEKENILSGSSNQRTFIIIWNFCVNSELMCC